MEAPGKDTLQPIELPKDRAARVLQVPSFLWARVGFGDAPASNPNKTHWFAKLDSGGVHSLGCHGFPDWGEETSVFHVPRESFLT